MRKVNDQAVRSPLEPKYEAFCWIFIGENDGVAPE